MSFSCRYCRPTKEMKSNVQYVYSCISSVNFSHERERYYFTSIRHKQLGCLARKRGGSISYQAIHHRIDGLSSKYDKHQLQLAGYEEIAGGLEPNRNGETF